MKDEGFLARLDTCLATTSIAERRTVRAIVASAALLAITLPILEFIEINHSLDSDKLSLWGLIITYTSFWLRVRIALALTTNSILIWPFKAKRLVGSTLAMAWTVAEYVLWFNWSARVKDSVGTGRLPEASAFGLYRATFLDIIVLALTFMIVTWLAKALMSLCVSSKSTPEQHVR